MLDIETFEYAIFELVWVGFPCETGTWTGDWESEGKVRERGKGRRTWWCVRGRRLVKGVWGQHLGESGNFEMRRQAELGCLLSGCEKCVEA